MGSVSQPSTPPLEPYLHTTSTLSNFYTGLKLGSKTHFYGRAAAEEVLASFLSALLRPRSGRGGFSGRSPTERAGCALPPHLLAEGIRDHAGPCRQSRLAPTCLDSAVARTLRWPRSRRSLGRGKWDPATPTSSSWLRSGSRFPRAHVAQIVLGRRGHVQFGWSCEGGKNGRFHGAHASCGEWFHALVATHAARRARWRSAYLCRAVARRLLLLRAAGRHAAVLARRWWCRSAVSPWCSTT